MSFLMGSTKARSNVNEDAQGLYGGLIDYINSQGFGGLNTNGPVDPSMIEPYQKLFRDQNAQNFGQVKESAGTLTGSGLSKNLGIAGAQASTQQGAFLADLIMRKRAADADRWAQLLGNTLNSQAAGVQYTHQPGFLDYAFQGAAAAAPFLGGIGSGGNMAASRAGGAGIVQGEFANGGQPPAGQLGQASFYRFLRPGDPLYGQEGARNRPLDDFLFGERDSFGTGSGPRRY